MAPAACQPVLRRPGFDPLLEALLVAHGGGVALHPKPPRACCGRRGRSSPTLRHRRFRDGSGGRFAAHPRPPAPPSAWAAGRSPGAMARRAKALMREAFEKWDSDGNGTISREDSRRPRCGRGLSTAHIPATAREPPPAHLLATQAPRPSSAPTHVFPLSLLFRAPSPMSLPPCSFRIIRPARGATRRLVVHSLLSGQFHTNPQWRQIAVAAEVANRAGPRGDRGPRACRCGVTPARGLCRATRRRCGGGAVAPSSANAATGGSRETPRASCAHERIHGTRGPLELATSLRPPAEHRPAKANERRWTPREREVKQNDRPFAQSATRCGCSAVGTVCRGPARKDGVLFSSGAFACHRRICRTTPCAQGSCTCLRGDTYANVDQGVWG